MSYFIGYNVIKSEQMFVFLLKKVALGSCKKRKRCHNRRTSDAESRTKNAACLKKKKRLVDRVGEESADSAKARRRNRFNKAATRGCQEVIDFWKIT